MAAEKHNIYYDHGNPVDDVMGDLAPHADTVEGFRIGCCPGHHETGQVRLARARDMGIPDLYAGSKMVEALIRDGKIDDLCDLLRRLGANGVEIGDSDGGFSPRELAEKSGQANGESEKRITTNELQEAAGRLSGAGFKVFYKLGDQWNPPLFNMQHLLAELEFALNSPHVHRVVLDGGCEGKTGIYNRLERLRLYLFMAYIYHTRDRMDKLIVERNKVNEGLTRSLLSMGGPDLRLGNLYGEALDRVEGRRHALREPEGLDNTRRIRAVITDVFESPVGRTLIDLNFHTHPRAYKDRDELGEGLALYTSDFIVGPDSIRSAVRELMEIQAFRAATKEEDCDPGLEEAWRNIIQPAA